MYKYIYVCVCISGWWFVLKTPLKSVKVRWHEMTFPTEWKNTIHVPNRQPVVDEKYMLHKEKIVKRWYSNAGIIVG